MKALGDSLRAAQQESLLFTHPDQLGQLDGLPSVVRDRANRSPMANQKGRLQADKERLDLLGSARTPEQSAQLDAINKSLGGIQLAAGINGANRSRVRRHDIRVESGPWYERGWNAAVHSRYWDDGNKSLVTWAALSPASQPTSA
jgi:hypothetical protein